MLVHCYEVSFRPSLVSDWSWRIRAGDGCNVPVVYVPIVPESMSRPFR